MTGGAPMSTRQGAPPAILAAKWIAPRIAYISFSLMPDDPATVSAIDRFMRDHASARAIIIDVRQDHGGGIGGVDAIFKYLYAKPRLLGFFDERTAVLDDKEDSPFDSGPTIRKVKGPPGFERYEHSVKPDAREHRLFKAKVFYLTSSRTASDGEYMAHILKVSRRGEVIGETTFGADHFGAYIPIGQGLQVFMPWGRLSDPVTGEDWEGKGVAPTISAPADQALDVALRLSRAGTIKESAP
jgi:C-terminal processing protease CtpA/Prc